MLRIHFIGIGGIGVSALAKYFMAQGARVSGSDAARSEITDELKTRGAKIFIGHRRSNVPRQCDRVIYSAAVKPDNRERMEAALRMIPQMSYAQAIGELTRKYFTIAVSGSHGKSTTTALIALILMRAGSDPTVIIGTKLQEFYETRPRKITRPGLVNSSGENFRMGRSNHLVLEADEWNRSFHEYSPDIVVLTNIDKEHLDTYKTYGGVIKGFARYLRNVKRGGIIIANWKDRGVRAAIAAYGSYRSNKTNKTNKTDRSDKIIWYNRGSIKKHPLAIPGTHSQLNAEAAFQTAKLLGVKRSVADKVFQSYRGAWRRLELLHSRFTFHDSRFTMYSDYAHHPTEIKATLQALREKHPKAEITAVFQPHQQDRLTRLFKEFARAFKKADRVIIVPIYVVKGREYSKGKTSEDLARAIKGACYARNAREALQLANLSNGVLVFMSAGDLDGKIRKLLSN